MELILRIWLEKIVRLYHWIDLNLKAPYSGIDIFNTFERVYEEHLYSEHFTVLVHLVEIKPPDQLPRTSIQSPDDLDMVCRKKGGKEIRG